MPKLRLSLSDDADAKLKVLITRTDAAPGEPASLMNYHDVAPGETIDLPVYPRSLISIAECSDG